MTTEGCEKGEVGMRKRLVPTGSEPNEPVYGGLRERVGRIGTFDFTRAAQDLWRSPSCLTRVIDEYANLADDHHCGWYDATVNPFPVYDHPSGDSHNKVVKYIEVTEGAYYQFDLVVKSGFNFDRCDALIFDLYVDGKRKEGIVADQEAYDDDNKVGRGRWAVCFGGVRTGADDALKIHRLKFAHLKKPQTSFKSRKKKSDAATIRVKVRRYKRHGHAPRRESVVAGRSKGYGSDVADRQPVTIAPENYIGKYVGKHPLATFIFKYGTREYLRSLGVITDSDPRPVASAPPSLRVWTSTVQRPSHPGQAFTSRPSPDQQEEEGEEEIEQDDSSISRSQVRSEDPNQDHAQLPEFQCSHCGQWHDVRDRPKHYRTHGVAPPALHTEARRAYERDADDSRRTRSHYATQNGMSSSLPVTQSTTNAKNARSRLSGSMRGASAEVGLGDDDSNQHEEDPRMSRRSPPVSNTSQPTSRTSVSESRRGKRSRTTTGKDHRPQKVARVGFTGHCSELDLPSESDAADDNIIESSRSVPEDMLRRARAGKRRATTANPPSVSGTDDEGFDHVESAADIEALQQFESDDQGGVDEGEQGTLYQQQDGELRSGRVGVDADHRSLTPRPQLKESMSVKPEEEHKFFSSNRADEDLKLSKQAHICRYLNKLKNDLYLPEAGNQFQSQQRSERISKIKKMERECETLIEDDSDDDDEEVEEDLKLKKRKQKYIRNTLDEFETEILGGSTGLWQRKSGLKNLKTLKREFKNLIQDERERSGGVSFGGSVTSSEVISLDE